MPRGDGTGPAGFGPMTGRGMGFCAGYSTPGYLNPGFGRGFGRGYGRGFGRGFGRWMGWASPYAGWAYPAAPVAPIDARSESEFLRNQAKMLEDELGAIKGRLDELAKTANKDE